MSRLIAFKIVATVVTCALLLFQLVIWKKLAPRVARSRFRKIIRVAYFAMVFAGQSVMWFAVLIPGRGLTTTLPDWYLPIHGALLGINYAHFFWLLPLALLWLIGSILTRLTARLPIRTVESGPGKENTDEISRSDFLKSGASTLAVGVNLLPTATSAATISGMFLGSREIWVNEKQINIKNLHEDLKGLRILQISTSVN
jgi:hypothetical protein